MNIWGFLAGLVAGIVPILLCLRALGPRRFIFGSPYLKGALIGIVIWVVLNALLYIEASHDFLGILRGAEGLGTMVIVTSSLQGFITSGLAAALISEKLLKKK